jgi:hypothetical protein
MKGLVSVRLEDGNFEVFKGLEVKRKFAPRADGKAQQDDQGEGED